MEGQIEINAHFLQKHFQMFIAKRNEQSGSFTQEKKKGEVDKFGFLFFTFHAINSESFCFCFNTLNLLLEFYLSQKYSISKLILLKNKSNCDEESVVWKSLKRKRLAHKGDGTNKGRKHTEADSWTNQGFALEKRQVNNKKFMFSSFPGSTLCASLYSHPMHKPPNKVVDCKIAAVLTYTYILTYTS